MFEIDTPPIDDVHIGEEDLYDRDFEDDRVSRLKHNMELRQRESGADFHQDPGRISEDKPEVGLVSFSSGIFFPRREEPGMNTA